MEDRTEAVRKVQLLMMMANSLPDLTGCSAAADEAQEEEEEEERSTAAGVAADGVAATAAAGFLLSEYSIQLQKHWQPLGMQLIEGLRIQSHAFSDDEVTEYPDSSFREILWSRNNHLLHRSLQRS